ncbi:unnamed protein product [Brassicogethes aeneus]|uniref:Sodium-independent sulfate anion transporter n=1 Tax=Brassicogethes aeneus TaxID=1431903 RepID=A0A9P0BMJ8_BRAAE|nr:unnamed protein product [Brassicogethes aeneus]
MRLENDDHRLANDATREEQDVQGAGGGGHLINNAYSNPAFSTSIDIEKNTQFKGSNDFILVDDHRTNSVKEVLKNAVPWLTKKCQTACSKKMLNRRFPICSWLPKYNRDDAIGDLVAGVTVGLTVIPQALAYSNIAGLPAQYGLYSSFLGCFVYIFLGSCKDVPMGPTAIASLLTYQTINKYGVQHAILLCFLTGSVQLLMGIFGLGFLIDFVSGPVSSGFTSAVALIIVTSQVKDVLGIKASGSTFVNTWQSISQDIHNTNAWDTVFGISCIAVLLIMRILATIRIGPTENDENKQPNRFQKLVNSTFWLIGTSRNAILVIVGGFIGYTFCLNGEPPFKVIGALPQGLPTPMVPPFGYENVSNGTTAIVSFTEMVTDLGSGILVVPLIGLLENIAICKAFSNGKPVDATQELLAIGLSNIANSFVQSFPGSGSLSRSAVLNSSGVRTPLSGLYTSILVILALLFFTPYFYYIPKATLAAIIIAAVVFMVEVKVVKPMWRSKKSDLILGLATFIACLVLPLEVGIIVGVGINLLFILYHAARPKISVEKLTTHSGIDYMMLTPDRCLIFPSVDYVRNLVTKHSIRQGIPVVIDCSHIYGADYTAATVVETLTQDFAARDQPLFFYNLKPAVSAVFEGLSPKEFVVYYNEDTIDELLKSTPYIKKQQLNL